MINIQWRNNKETAKIVYSKGGQIKRKKVNKTVLTPHKRIDNDEYIKKCKDIYTQNHYYIKKSNIPTGLTLPYKINSNKEGVPFYDYDLALKLLYYQDIIDDGIDFPNYAYYDIETTSLDPSDGIVTSVVFIDKNNEVETFVNENGEKQMLNEIVKYCRKNKIMSLIGFNSKDFDDMYLKYRLSVNGLLGYFNPVMNCNIDVMKMCNKLFISGSLASIAKQLGVIEKIELESNPIKLFYDGDLSTLVEYNIRDVEVTKAICEKMDILSFCQALWELSWCDFRNLNANSRLNDCYFNKRLWEDNLMVSFVDLNYKGAFGGGFNYIKR